MKNVCLNLTQKVFARCSLLAGKASMMMLLFTKHLIIDFDRGAIGQKR